MSNPDSAQNASQNQNGVDMNQFDQQNIQNQIGHEGMSNMGNNLPNGEGYQAKINYAQEQDLPNNYDDQTQMRQQEIILGLQALEDMGIDIQTLSPQDSIQLIQTLA